MTLTLYRAFACWGRGYLHAAAARARNFVNAETGAKLAAAAASNLVLRYVGVVDPSGGSRVELAAYPPTHPFASLSGSDNMMPFTTKRYVKQPLVVCGPGAGAEVTAGGVFVDLLRLAA